MKDLGWFFLLIIILVGLWLFLGRPTGEGPFITPPFSRSPFEQSAGEQKQTTGEKTAEGQQQEQEAEKKVQKISLSARSVRTSDPQKEYLEIRADSRNTESINITGLKLKSQRTGENFTIGTGAKLAFSGQTNIQSPIILEPGQRVYVITGQSPIGTSFQLNICTGYFEQFQDFTPYLPKECPHPKELAPLSLSNACLDYIERLPRCEMPLKATPLEAGNDCAVYVSENVNYKSCVANYKSQKDFYQDTWMVYLGRGAELWPEKRETIMLFNQSGEKITEVSY